MTGQERMKQSLFLTANWLSVWHNNSDGHLSRTLSNISLQLQKKKNLFAIEKSFREHVQNNLNTYAPSKKCFSIPWIKGVSKVRRVIQESKWQVEKIESVRTVEEREKRKKSDLGCSPSFLDSALPSWLGLAYPSSQKPLYLPLVWSRFSTNWFFTDETIPGLYIH